MNTSYRGRIAPTPTGYLHLGHARTFLEAQKRTEEANGTLILRVENIDTDRCKGEYVDAVYEDLEWVGIRWDEGPDVGGLYGSYLQSERMPAFKEALLKLKELGMVYPCSCSRKDLSLTESPVFSDDGEMLYPNRCRHRSLKEGDDPFSVNWRFRVPDSERVSFVDENLGELSYTSGIDFGDFLVWRRDGMPSYELAVVIDDIAMRITEVVRGKDLLVSTARQILLYRALDATIPGFYHCPLVVDETGKRLAKRDKAMGLRELRAHGANPHLLLENLRLK